MTRSNDKCSSCGLSCNKSESRIMCTTCGHHQHFACTKIPSYRLFWCTRQRRGFICNECTLNSTKYKEHKEWIPKADKPIINQLVAITKPPNAEDLTATSSESKRDHGNDPNTENPHLTARDTNSSDDDLSEPDVAPENDSPHIQTTPNKTNSLTPNLPMKGKICRFYKKNSCNKGRAVILPTPRRVINI